MIWVWLVLALIQLLVYYILVKIEHYETQQSQETKIVNCAHTNKDSGITEEIPSTHIKKGTP